MEGFSFNHLPQGHPGQAGVQDCHAVQLEPGHGAEAGEHQPADHGLPQEGPPIITFTSLDNIAV